MSRRETFSNQPLSEKPDIVRFGNAMDEHTIQYMQRAADELNLTLEQPKYCLVLDANSKFSPDGARLAEGWQRVRLRGPLTEDDVSELWTRAEEIGVALANNEPEQI